MNENQLPRGKLSLWQAILIKRELWYNKLQGDIAAEFKISQSTVSNIRRGLMWPKAEWPDKSEGPIPMYRFNELLERKGVDKSTKRAELSTPDISKKSEYDTIDVIRELQQVQEEADDDLLAAMTTGKKGTQDV
jgi:hypothetical protein